jgi:hypothetical protein
LGKTDAAILETAMFFCSLKHPCCTGASLQFNNCLFNEKKKKTILPLVVDFAALREDQLSRIMEYNHIRQVELGIRKLEPRTGQDSSETTLSFEFDNWQSA